VGRQLALRHVRDQPGEVDEAAYVAARDRGGHDLGTAPVTVGEVGAGQRVDEVDHPVDARHGLGDRFAVGDVAPDRAHPLVPSEAPRVGPRR
jgi:hypothetical protein